MIKIKVNENFQININERQISIIIFSLFFSWVLSFGFQGQILYSFIEKFNLNSNLLIFTSIIAHFIGLFTCGFFISSMKAARLFVVGAIIFIILSSSVFFFTPTILWLVVIIINGFLSGCVVSSWGFFYKSATPKEERIKTAADVLIYSNIIMIFLDVISIYLSVYLALGLSLLMMILALIFALYLPSEFKNIDLLFTEDNGKLISIKKPVAFLSIFVIIITINSGLMYEVINPAYSSFDWLTSWYWAIPYIVALIVMRNFGKEIKQTYILYIATAMIGFAFISFMTLEKTAMSYLLVNTLMLGACGIYDLFWWSILGEMLDFHRNPAKIFGIGISANVLGVLIGGFIGRLLISPNGKDVNTTMIALGVVCVAFVILPPLHRSLTNLMDDHLYLRIFFGELAIGKEDRSEKFIKFKNLSDRESQVTSLLLKRKTYKMIAEELFISENTVKYYIKNIYTKFDVNSRDQLIKKILENNKNEK